MTTHAKDEPVRPPAPPAVSEAGYAAFLSYSSADAGAAGTLQRLIRRVGQRWYRRSTLRIFRDRTNESASKSLREWINGALETSDHLVLLASPNAAGSKWVDDELAFWKAHRDLSKVSIVLLSGEIVWSVADADFDWERTTALPPALRGWFTEEPKWLDARQPPDEKPRWSRRADHLRDAARAIAAQLRGVDKDRLAGEDERETRRALRTLRVGIAALSVLTLLFASATVVARQQFLAADAGQRLATARLLLNRADEAFNQGDTLTALRLGEAAHHLHPDKETHASLSRTLISTRYSGVLEGHTAAVYAVAFAPGGRSLATASGDWTVRLWDLTDPARPAPLGGPITGHTDTVSGVAFAPDGRSLATAGNDWTVRLWDLTDPARPAPLGGPIIGHTNFVSEVAFAPDGRSLATTSGDGTVRLWDLTDPARPAPLGGPIIGHTDWVRGVMFAPDGRSLATTSDDRTVRLWDLTDPAQPAPLGDPIIGHTGAVYDVAFAPDGRSLATASGDGTVRLWDLTDPARPRPLGYPLTGHTGTVWAVAFAPDGHSLATASDDQTVRLWSLTNPARPRPLGQPLSGHTGAVSGVAFAPDGRSLATAGGDQTVRLWDPTGPNADVRKPMQRACTLTHHSIGPDEWARLVPALPYRDACAS